MTQKQSWFGLLQGCDDTQLKSEQLLQITSGFWSCVWQFSPSWLLSIVYFLTLFAQWLAWEAAHFLTQSPACQKQYFSAVMALFVPMWNSSGPLWSGQVKALLSCLGTCCLHQQDVSGRNWCFTSFTYADSQTILSWKGCLKDHQVQLLSAWPIQELIPAPRCYQHHIQVT